jgi:hypothetical protein
MEQVFIQYIFVTLNRLVTQPFYDILNEKRNAATLQKYFRISYLITFFLAIPSIQIVNSLIFKKTSQGWSDSAAFVQKECRTKARQGRSSQKNF